MNHKPGNKKHSTSPAAASLQDRSIVLESYIAERQPFHIRWGMFVIAALLLLLIAVSYFIRIPETITVQGELTGTGSGKIIVTSADTAAARKIKEGQDVHLAVPGTGLDFNGQVATINYAAGNGTAIISILPAHSEDLAAITGKITMAHPQAELHVRGKGKRLLSGL